jgi:hypothetical protein
MMLIGPDTNTRLLEVGLIATDGQDYVIHSMPAQAEYLSMIDLSRGD